MRYAVPLRKQHRIPEVNRGIFARLDDAIAAELPAKGQIDGFFRWALQELDADEYAEIQRTACAPPAKTAKWLSFVFYSRHKMPLAVWLDLHRREGKGRRVLDLGCGPGHFLLICRFFGHQGMGLDLPFPEGHLFNRLCRFFKIEKIDHRIEAYEPLTAVGRFDLITSSITQFNHDKATNKPWGIPEWQFFIAYMQHNHLMPDGKMYLTLTSGDRQDDVWRYLRAIAEPTGDSGLLIPC